MAFLILLGPKTLAVWKATLFASAAAIASVPPAIVAAAVSQAVLLPKLGFAAAGAAWKLIISIPFIYQAAFLQALSGAFRHLKDTDKRAIKRQCVEQLRELERKVRVGEISQSEFRRSSNNIEAVLAALEGRAPNYMPV